MTLALSDSSQIGQTSVLHHTHSFYKWLVLSNVMIGTFMAVLDASIVNVGLPTLMAAFGVTVDKIEWVATAYLLVLAVMLPTSGWVADHFGYKRTYLLALTLFTTGSLLCGIAWNENALIMFRIIQGAGAGFLMPVGMAIVTREFPPERRGIALGFWGIAAAASVSFGPLIGGYLIDNFSWHEIFYVNVPVGMVGVFATMVIQREYKTEHTRSFDFLGFVSMAVFLTFLLLALADGNASWNTGGWTSTFILTCFVLSGIGLLVFLLVEFTIKHPLIELRLLKDFNFGITNIILFIFGLGMFGSTFLMPLYLQNSLNYTPFQAGLVFLPVGILQGMMAPVAGFLSDRVDARIPATIGIILLGISLYLNYFLSLFSMHAQIMLPLYLRGFAMGMMFTPLSTLALTNVPKHKMAQASGLFNVIRQVGGSFGVAIFGALLTRRVIFHSASYANSVCEYSPAFKNTMYNLEHFSQHVVGGSMYQCDVRGKALIVNHIMQQAFVSAVNDDFLVAGGITIACLVPIFFLRRKRHSNRGGEKIVPAD
ncbi:MAG TPA: DHA2 family efflux MFS transporter permease subunit [Candidatus Acidoferrales bacterium]|nr:DHA2 family efflux MFS transporter permease subunit [Candidatus Acidoferrales bacterium]